MAPPPTGAVVLPRIDAAVGVAQCAAAAWRLPLREHMSSAPRYSLRSACNRDGRVVAAAATIIEHVCRPPLAVNACARLLAPEGVEAIDAADRRRMMRPASPRASIHTAARSLGLGALRGGLGGALDLKPLFHRFFAYRMSIPLFCYSLIFATPFL